MKSHLSVLTVKRDTCMTMILNTLKHFFKQCTLYSCQIKMRLTVQLASAQMLVIFK